MPPKCDRDPPKGSPFGAIPEIPPFNLTSPPQMDVDRSKAFALATEKRRAKKTPQPQAGTDDTLATAALLMTLTKAQAETLSVEETAQLHCTLSSFIAGVNKLLPSHLHFGAKDYQEEAVRPTERTATITKQVSKPAPPVKRPTFAEAAKGARPKAPQKHLQQGTKASHLVLRPAIANPSPQAAQTIREGFQTLPFVKDGSLTIKEADWTLHGNFRIVTNTSLSNDHQDDLADIVGKYSTNGQRPEILN